MKKIKIYTDGACSGNQNDINIGGYGAILEYGDHRKELWGGEKNTTNNRMEMMALLAALNALTKEDLEIEVYSDSSYLMNCFREKWYVKWQKNNWISSKKTPVENQDLWNPLISFLDRHKLSFYRVKGHVNLNSKNTKIEPLFEKFKEWNGSHYSMEDFFHVTEMNCRADELANLGMADLKEEDK